MAKSISTVDKKLVNYANIVVISVEQGEYSDDNGNVSSDVYGLIATDITNNMHILGVYDSKNEADAAENKLKKWLECEAFGIYDMNASEGDE